GPVAHALGLSRRPGHAAGVGMVARERDGARDATARDRIIDEQTEPTPVARAQPADACWQARELHGLARSGNPVGDRIAFEVLEDERVDLVDVLRIAGDRQPAERADALAEERPDVALGEPADVAGAPDAEHLR